MVKVIIACLLLALGAWGCDDSGGSRGPERPCQNPTFWTNETCFGPNIVLPPGLCEPLVCEAGEFEFLLLPEDAICDSVDCATVSCDGGNLIFMDLLLNEDGDLEGVLADEEGIIPFICFID